MKNNNMEHKNKTDKILETILDIQDVHSWKLEVIIELLKGLS